MVSGFLPPILFYFQIKRVCISFKSQTVNVSVVPGFDEERKTDRKESRTEVKSLSEYHLLPIIFRSRI